MVNERNAKVILSNSDLLQESYLRGKDKHVPIRNTAMPQALLELS